MLKPINREQTVAVISVADSAIDWERSDKAEAKPGDGGVPILKYARERFTAPCSWRASVQFLDGEAPTEFVLGIIPSSEYVRIEDECKGTEGHRRNNELAWRMFLASVRDIKGGFDTENVNRIKIDGLEYLDPAWLRQQFVGRLRSVATEIGTVAWMWNRLTEAEIKN